MKHRRNTFSAALMSAALVAAVPAAHAQAGETFSATATVKTAGGATATAPFTATVDRTMSPQEAEKLTKAFETGGVAGLRKALEGVPPTGSIKIGGSASTPTRLTIERTTDKGRLITIVTDKPILFMGAGLPGAKPTAGHDFAVADIEVDASGSGSGMFAPAARITVKQGVFVIEDYAAEPVRLTAVKAKK